MDQPKSEVAPLTGLRGIAALLVVIAHYAWFCAPFPRASAPRIYEDVFNIAGFGMSLFFVLSGFVITYNYVDFPWRAQPLQSFGRFLYLRLSRLYPALLLFIFYIVENAPPGDTRFWQITTLHVLSAQSWLPFVDQGDILANGRFNLSWSISTEIMMYGLFALAMTALAWRPRFMVAIILVMLGGIVSLSQAPEQLAAYISKIPPIFEPVTQGQAASWFFYISPWFRIIDFAAGSLAAFAVMLGYVARLPLLLASTLAVSAAFYIVGFHIWRAVGEHGVHFVTMQLISTAAFAVIVACSAQPSLLNRLLSVRPLMFVGTISYSLYLFHILAPRMMHLAQVGNFSAWAVAVAMFNMVVATILALFIAYVIYAVVEHQGRIELRRLMNYRGRSAYSR